MVNINRTDFKALVDMGVVSEKKEGLLLSITNNSMMNILDLEPTIIGLMKY